MVERSITWLVADATQSTDGEAAQTASSGISPSTPRSSWAVSSRPVMIAEMGSAEQPGSPTAKGDWITSAFEKEIPQNFPLVRAVLSFDAPGRGFSYPLTSSTQALQGFSQVAGSAAYQARLPG
jgi:hypothetical protein